MSERDPAAGTDRGGLFDAVLARGAVADAVADRAWLSAMLEVESALARAEAGVGLIPAAAADAIARATAAPDIDLATLGRSAAASGNPVVPLVAALRDRLDEPTASFVHLGATSQDILDSAMMLVAGRAIDVLLVDVDGAADAAVSLAVAHRDTPMAARTLLQQALPTTFGAKAAGWLAGLDAAADGLTRIRTERLAAQLGGGGGTLAALSDRGPAVLAAFAGELRLAEPPGPWHTERSRVVELATSLGVAAAAISKPAIDLILLAQTEVGETRDGAAGRGGSSTLPHKRNPVAAIAARASAGAAPGLVAALLTAAGSGEHERAAGGWHAEWRPLTELFRSAGSAAAWLRDALENLEIDPKQMRANLDRTGGQILAERLVVALAPVVGGDIARREVEAAAGAATTGNRVFADELAAQPTIGRHLPPDRLAELLDPTTYLGSAGVFVDRILAAHRDGRERRARLGQRNDAP